MSDRAKGAGDKAAGEGKAADAKILTREEVLGAKDRRTDPVEVPEWGGAVVVRSLSKGEQLEIQRNAVVDDEIQPDRMQMYIFLEGCVEPEFGPDDLAALKEKNAKAMDRVINRVMELSGMAQSIEEIEATFREGT